MFDKLKKRIVIIVSLVSLVILFSSFSLIYITSTKRNSLASVIPIEAPDYNVEIKNIITERIKYERESANRALLTTLVRSGIAIEIIVFVVASLLAEEIIKPVKKTYDSQKEFIANASHEIKTPLAAIEANLEAADIHDNPWIDNVAYETDKLSRLNVDLLRLSRLDSISLALRTADIDLDKFINRIVDSVRTRCEDKEILVSVESAKININSLDLEEIISILLDNAIKYSKRKIVISCTNREICIANDGKTIPEDKLDHIFERFYQVDKSSDGVGLGLSIAKSLAEKNSWQLTADSTKSQTTFRLTF